MRTALDALDAAVLAVPIWWLYTDLAYALLFGCCGAVHVLGGELQPGVFGLPVVQHALGVPPVAPAYV